MISCSTALFILTAVIASVNGSWHYGEEEKWPPLCQEGKEQSPVSLEEDTAQETTFPALEFEKYNDNYPVKVKNNGHSAEIRLHVQDQPKIRGGGLDGTYVLDHLHFHWQSEHTINSYRFPLELHLVHYSDKFGSLGDALKVRNGTAVFSVLFDLSPDDSRDFKPLIDVIDILHDKIDLVEQRYFNILDFLPKDIAGFFRYQGSLTTPDCTEGLVWTVFTNTLPISKAQVKHFSTIQTEDKHELPKNYRALQNLNDRTVYLKQSPIRPRENMAKSVTTDKPADGHASRSFASDYGHYIGFSLSVIFFNFA